MPGLVRTHEVTAQTELGNDVLSVLLEDHRDASLAQFGALDERTRADLAADAWRIGLRALQNAHAQAEEARLQDVGSTLVTDLRREIDTYLTQQEKSVTAILRRYFDPHDGQVTERMQAFVRQDGELARMLRGHVGTENSILAKTLAERVGETSPLFKVLSPTESDGIIQQLEAKVKTTLDAQTEVTRRALDPHAEGTPVHDFLAALQQRLKAAGDDTERMVKQLTKALDANDDESLINQMRRDVEKTNRELTKALNVADDHSPLGTIRNTLTKMIKQRMDEQERLLLGAEKRQRAFENEVKSTLARLEQRKKETARSTHGGLDFEDLVSTFAEATLGNETYIHERTGASVGALPNNKKGDHVVRFTPEHAFSGSALVVEAKRDQSYTVARALEELEESRRNRNSDAAVFVMAASHAPTGFPRFARYGNDILVTWDDADERTDPYLHAALVAGLCLVTRRQRVVDDGERDAVGDLEGRLLKETKRLDKMSGMTERIRSNAERLDAEIQKAHKAVDLMIRKTRKTLEALDIEARDLDEERAHPIDADPDALRRGVEAIRGQQPEEIEPDTPDADDPGWRRQASIQAPEALAFRRDRRGDTARDD